MSKPLCLVWLRVERFPQAWAGLQPERMGANPRGSANFKVPAPKKIKGKISKGQAKNITGTLKIIKAPAPPKAKGNTKALKAALGKPGKRMTWRSLQKDIDEATVRRTRDAALRRRSKPRRRPGEPVTIGSDCAGLLSEGTALELLGVPHTHVFASEANTSVRHLLYDTYGKTAMTYYKDVCRRSNSSPDTSSVDVYVFGFPCTPYSPAGHGRGLQDEKGRGQVLFHCLDYVKHKAPAVVIAENSHRFASSRPVPHRNRIVHIISSLSFHTSSFITCVLYATIMYRGARFKEVREQMITTLESLHYSVKWKVLNTRNHGIPQSRPRFYLVAILSELLHEGDGDNWFDFPPDIPAESIHKFMDKNDEQREQPPKTTTCSEALKAGLEKLKQKNVDASRDPCFIDVNATPAWSSAMVGVCPCLTSTRCTQGGHFYTSGQGMLALTEMQRLQGIPDGRFDAHRAKVRPTDLAFATGNAMSVNVLMRILPDALYAANLLERRLALPTRFASKLRRDARRNSGGST